MKSLWARLKTQEQLAKKQAEDMIKVYDRLRELEVKERKRTELEKDAKLEAAGWECRWDIIWGEKWIPPKKSFLKGDFSRKEALDLLERTEKK